MKAVLFSALLASPIMAALPAGTWPQWRGDGTGVSAETDLPTVWSETENVRWRQKIPGYGWSNPVVAKGRVFLTTAEFEGQQAPVQKGPPAGEPPPQTQVQRKALCLEAATGKLLWERVVDSNVPEQGNHASNTWATETPVTDGERVYFVFGNVGVFCFDLEG